MGGWVHADPLVSPRREPSSSVTPPSPHTHTSRPPRDLMAMAEGLKEVVQESYQEYRHRCGPLQELMHAVRCEDTCHIYHTHVLRATYVVHTHVVCMYYM